jgi:hypothetical protein
MKIVITPTGGRPEAMDLCIKYFNQQTERPNEWLVPYDLHPVATQPFPGITNLMERDILPKEPKHTLPRNLLFALCTIGQEARTRDTKIVMMEDDEWYHPDYLKTMFAALDESQIVGLSPSVYYKLYLNAFRDCNNLTHASLCATGFTGDLIPQIIRICMQDDPLIDLMIWRRIQATKKLVTQIKGHFLNIGIKGMPGRKGTTTGWNDSLAGYTIDMKRYWLEEQIGEDAKLYANY